MRCKSTCVTKAIVKCFMTMKLCWNIQNILITRNQYEAWSNIYTVLALYNKHKSILYNTFSVFELQLLSEPI